MKSRAIHTAIRFTALSVALSALTLSAALLSGCERQRIAGPSGDDLPPLPPAGLLVEGAHDGYIFIGWIRNSEQDLRGYIVYRGEGDPGTAFIVVDTLVNNYFIDAQRSYDSTYYYFVTALDDTGYESASSDTVSATSPNLLDPEAPRTVFVGAHNFASRQFFRIEWSEAEEFDLQGYNIYRSVTHPASPKQEDRIAWVNTTLFNDSSANTLGKRWYYAVTSVDNGGRESILSEVDSDYITPVPQLLEPEAFGKAKSYPLFRWKRVDGVPQYLITVSSQEFTGEVWSQVTGGGSTDIIEIRYTGSALEIGRSYFWRVSTLTKSAQRPNAISGAREFQVES